MNKFINNDLISRAAAIAEIEEYIEEYSELEPETGFHSLKWCAMEEAKDTLLMLPAIPAIPVEWLRKKMNMADDAGDLDSVDLISWLIQTWQKEQEAR